jgi:glutamate--cysteine ligase
MSSDSGGEAGEPVARADLVRYFREACRASRGAPRRIGVEHELLPVDPATGAAWPYGGPRGVEAVFRALLAAGFEDPQRAERPTRAVRGGAAINTEPGAQTEISGTPWEGLDAVEGELRELWGILRKAAQEAGFRYISHGLQPLSLAGEIEQVPKRRYAIMARYFEERGGPRFSDMMRRTGSVQASFDFDDEADAGRKLRLALLAAPFAAALFANSSVAGGRASGFASERTAIWLATDDARCGLVPEALEGEWSFERYVDFALRVPTILVRAEDGGVAPAGGRSFGDVLASGVAGRRATIADWELHLSTIFTDARLKTVVECRACDAPPPADVMAVPAFWTGLLYDRAALEAAGGLVAPYLPVWQEVKAAVARDGLRARIAGRPAVLDVGRELVKLAAAGLRARGLGEERYIVAAEAAARTGRTAADVATEVVSHGGLAELVAAAAI